MIILFDPLENGKMFQSFSPCINFSQFIERLWISKSRLKHGFAVSEYYPNANADLLFELSPDNCRVLLFGPVTKKSYLQTNNHCEYLSVQFWPGQLKRLSGIYPKELVDQFVELNHIFHYSVDQIGIMLNNTTTTTEKMNILHNVLVNLTHDCSHIDSTGQSAIEQIIKTSGFVKIKAVAGSHEVSVRRLETLIKDQLGLPPKFFARTIRLQQILKTLFRGIPDTLTDLAFYAGYADQSHFIHDFKELTGKLPTFFLQPNREDAKITYIPDIHTEPVGTSIFHQI